jgi:hypothetical protein
MTTVKEHGVMHWQLGRRQANDKDIFQCWQQKANFQNPQSRGAVHSYSLQVSSKQIVVGLTRLNFSDMNVQVKRTTHHMIALPLSTNFSSALPQYLQRSIHKAFVEITPSTNSYAAELSYAGGFLPSSRRRFSRG